MRPIICSGQSCARNWTPQKTFPESLQHVWQIKQLHVYLCAPFQCATALTGAFGGLRLISPWNIFRESSQAWAREEKGGIVVVQMSVIGASESRFTHCGSTETRRKGLAALLDCCHAHFSNNAEIICVGSLLVSHLLYMAALFINSEMYSQTLTTKLRQTA